jgi:hypothetical protein
MQAHISWRGQALKVAQYGYFNGKFTIHIRILGQLLLVEEQKVSY